MAAGSVLAAASATAERAGDEAEVRFGRNDGYDRLVFEWPAAVEVDVFKSGGELVITFDRPARMTLPPASDFTYRTDLMPQLLFEMHVEDGGRRIRAAVDPDVRLEVTRWQTDQLIAIDIYPAAVAASDVATDATPEPEPVREPPTPVPAPQPQISAPETGIPEVDGDEETVVADEPLIEGDSALQAGDESGDEPESEETAALPDDDEIEDGEIEDVETDVAEPDDADGEDGLFEFVIGGEIDFGVSIADNELLSDGDDDEDYAFFSNGEIYFDAYGTIFDETDAGVSITLNATADDPESVNADETYLYFSNGFGDLRLGRTSGAEDEMALGADTIAAGTGGIDGDAANLGEIEIETSGDAAKIAYYTPREDEGWQFGVSYSPDTGDEENDDDGGFDLEHYASVGLNFIQTFGETRLSLATVGSIAESEATDADDLRAFSLGGTLAFDRYQLGASYGRSASDFFFDYDFATFGLTTTFGDVSTGFGYNYVDDKSAGTSHIFVLSGDTPIVPGVELQGDVSFADPEGDSGNVASVIAVEMTY